MSQDPERPGGAPGRRFLTTRWSVVLRAGGEQAGEVGDTREALESLAQSYWFPLYGYVRRRGYGEDEARDLTQAFFARLLERRDVASAAPEKGRFRSFLLTSLQHFLVNAEERERALKRGGGRAPLSIDANAADSRYGLEPTDEETPERAFERSWARSVLERTLERLHGEYEARGKEELFAALRPHLVAEDAGQPHAALAAELGLSEGATKVALHRLRSRYRRALRAEVADTVGEASDVEDELRQLFRALS
ncbi:MAG: sigma-70 family RNA polymerase sigma factor [Planctomycetota bacterium]